MLGLMQDRQLLLSSLLTYAATYHGETEIVSRSIEGPIHRTTYAKAEVRAKKLAQALIRLGVGGDDLVVSVAWNSYRHFEIFYGVSGIGSVLHTVNPRLFEDQVGYIINHGGGKYVFLDTTFLALLEKLAPSLSHVKGYVVLAEADAMPETTLPNVMCYEDLLAAEDGDFTWPDFDERTASSLCYTSGTTGNPKGVLFSHRSNIIHAFAASATSAFSLSANDVLMATPPMYHVNGWGFPYSAPMNGTKMVLPGSRMDPASLHELLAAEQVTFTSAVPTILTLLAQYMDDTGKKLPHMERIAVGGSALSPALTARYRDDYDIHLMHAWGMTETSPHAVAATLTRRVTALPEEDRRRVTKKAGRVPYGMEVRIVTPEGKDAPHDGESFGDVWVRGPWVAASYFKDDSDKRQDADGWFPTGDVATLDPYGYVQITDRTKDVIKSGGEWISSIDLENLALDHPTVRHAAVIGVPHPKWEERPLLLVVAEPGETPQKKELLAFLGQRVAKWWLPDDVVVVDEIPLTATGKIDKKRLRAEYQDHLDSSY